MTSRRWSAGEVVVLREVFRGKLWAVRPLRVIEDAGDSLALWCPRGTVRRVPITPACRPDPPSRGERAAQALELGDWDLASHVWDVSTIILVREGDWHATWVSFLESGEQLGWYVNFQEPYTRFDGGIDAMDLALDITVEADRSAWQWKDEDEFELFVKRGLIEAQVAERVRDEARRVLDRLAREEFPFDSPWPAWTPDPGWTIPRLPEEYAESPGDQS
jgi:hypothetical protein